MASYTITKQPVILPTDRISVEALIQTDNKKQYLVLFEFGGDEDILKIIQDKVKSFNEYSSLINPALDKLIPLKEITI